MSNQNDSPERPVRSTGLCARPGEAEGRLEAAGGDEALLGQAEGRCEAEPSVSPSGQDLRGLVVALAEASVRLSGSILPPAIEEVNRRFVDGELSAEEHLVVVLRLAAAFAAMGGESRRPRGGSLLGAQVGDAMLQAVRDVCDGRTTQPHAQGRDYLDIPEYLQQLAASLLGPDDGRRWWTERAFGLGWQRPIDVLAQPGGTQIVERLLRRIEAYVYTEPGPECARCRLSAQPDEDSKA